MKYTVLVFVKQVPDTQNITGDAMTPEGTVNRSALPAIFNPEDLNALEAALLPETTDYYYYALGKDYQHRFFTNYGDHVNFVNSSEYVGN